ncbi:diacylglycerol/lipid kinase family protein [Cognatilysobacter segetis]|uniref:diacylglycerol/lipid kinase family protein n=1 Tax=Cognatilysobacter segetis TaxID=2492394 RepID=UPI00105CD21D|nr:diacylglycerol kinase family protein [Lysobacter segetis]
MSPPLPVIINAHSNSGSDQVDAVRDALAAAGVEARLLVVDDPQRLDATIEEALSAGPACIVAAGGDGTINAVAAHAIRAGVPLAVLPAGTLNHFARDLKLPTALDEAAAVIARGHVREVDVGEVNGNLFLNNSSLGLYASMVDRRERLQARHGINKWLALLHASLSVLRHPHTFSTVINADGQALRRRTPFVFVGNNDYTVQGPHAGARSTLDDGMLSAYVLRPYGAWGLIGLAVRALFGRMVDGRDLDEIHATEIVVESHHGKTRVARDGEVEMTDTPVCFRVRPRALRVIAPEPGDA